MLGRDKILADDFLNKIRAADDEAFLQKLLAKVAHVAFLAPSQPRIFPPPFVGPHFGVPVCLAKIFMFKFTMEKLESMMLY